MKSNIRASWLMGVASAALSFGLAPAALAQEAQAVAAAGPQQVDDGDEEVRAAETIVVLGGITYRNRTDETAPVLEYGTDYFQRFEPLTVGDALKRVPSVAFLSDVLESDGVRLRGLDPAYTQILINGEKVPGSGSSSGAFGNGADGAFFVDRIPAELIERVEVVRSASANRSGDAMAGAINIVLRDGYSLDGGYVRAGALGFDDGRIRETYGAVWGGEVGGGRLLTGFNVQGRRNPKEKFSQRFDELGGDLDNIEDQTDTRDGTDYSANFAYEIEAGPGEFKVDGLFVRTDRQAFEDSIEYEEGVRETASLLTLNKNNVDTQQDSWALNGEYELDAFGGETSFKVGYAKFKQDEDEFENEIEYLRDSNPFPEADRFTGDLVVADIDDTEFKAKLEHEREFSFGELEFGLQYESKERENYNAEGRFRVSLAGGSQVPDASGAGIPGFVPPDLDDVLGDNTITRTQLAPYAMLSGETGQFAWEAGVRYESTEVEVEDRLAGENASKDYGIFLPSAHLRWNLTGADRVNASVARTIRNPSFDFLSPALLTGELGENDFQGDVNLEPETAWGIDLGYERQVGREGVIGINIFYRAVEDLIELATLRDANGVPLEGDEGEGTFIYTPVNSGDGTVYGVEFDASTPLSFIGLPDTGVFMNYSWLDSEIDDEFGSRKFNSQSDYVFNAGFIHDLKALDAAFGVTYRTQGDATSRVVGEEVVTSYGGVLEAFVEKSFGKNFTLRLTGSNLLDGSKDEVFDKFNTVEDQISRDYDEYELESEKAGPTWQLIGRYSF